MVQSEKPQLSDVDGTRGNDGAHARIKQHVQAEFEKWAHTYDRSWLNELVFFPSIRACQEEIVRWQAARGGGKYRMLDVGCGTGNLLLRAAHDPDAELLVGLDYTQE